jgi:hypothetical protein
VAPAATAFAPGHAGDPHYARNAPTCSGPADVLGGVWEPTRLLLLDPCRIAVGTVKAVHHMIDGDLTFTLVLEPRYRSLANVANAKLGGLHIEFMPRDGGHLPAPKVGDRVALTGAWVLDPVEHWNELHPVWYEQINGGAPNRSGPEFAGDPASSNNGNAAELCRDQEGQLCRGYSGSLGRCLPVTAGAGRYANSSCTAVGAGKRYEWAPATGGWSPLVNRGFTTGVRPGIKPVFQTIRGTKMVCHGETGTGEIVGRKLIAGAHMIFAGCSSARQVCVSPGRAAGEIVTHELFGRIGVLRTHDDSPHKTRTGIELKVNNGKPFAEFTCGAQTFSLRGSLVGQLPANRMLATETLSFVARRGRQAESHFESSPVGVLEASIGGGGFERIGLSLRTIQSNPEPVEVNTVG